MKIDFDYIVIKETNIIIKLIVYGWLILTGIIFILLFISFIISNNKLDLIFDICIKSGAIIAIIGFFFFLFKKEHSIIGKISLTEDRIIVKDYNNKEDNVFQISDIENMKIEYGGYQWELIYYGGSFGIDKGDNNKIEFKYNNQDYSFPFLSKDTKDLKKLKIYLSYLRKMGYKNTLYHRGRKLLVDKKKVRTRPRR